MPAVAGSLVRCAALKTYPEVFSATGFGHPSGWGVVWVPFCRQPGVCSHRLALAEATALAFTIWANNPVTPSQILCFGVPLMLSPAPMPAARTLQPEPCVAARRQICRLLALVEGGVPQGLDGFIIWMCERFFAARSTCSSVQVSVHSDKSQGLLSCVLNSELLPVQNF